MGDWHDNHQIRQRDKTSPALWDKSANYIAELGIISFSKSDDIPMRIHQKKDEDTIVERVIIILKK